MTDKLIERSVKLTKTPTDGSGQFTGVIHPFEIDSDNERIVDILDLPTTFPVRYQHAMGDPDGDIGEVRVSKVGDHLELDGQLNLSNPLAVLVYERMLLPPDDPRAMHEFSIGFLYNPTLTHKGADGETVIPEVKMFEVSIVVSGAQRTQLLTIKAAKAEALTRYGLKQVEADLSFTDAVLLGINPETLGLKTPPWHIEEQGDQYCVVADETGESVKCHPTREMAEAHLRALYANVPEATKAATEGDQMETGDRPEEVTADSKMYIDIVPRFVDDEGNEIDLAELGEKIKQFNQAAQPISVQFATTLKDKLSEAIDAIVAEVNSGKSSDETEGETESELDETETKAEDESESESETENDAEEGEKFSEPEPEPDPDALLLSQLDDIGNLHVLTPEQQAGLSDAQLHERLNDPSVRHDADLLDKLANL